MRKTQDLSRQDFSRFETQKVVSQPLQVVRPSIEKTAGENTCVLLNNFLSLSGALVILHTQWGASYQVISVVKMGAIWVKCYVLTPEGTRDTIKVPWYSNFVLSLGQP